MKLLKLIPAAAIALTAFTTFEAKAGEEHCLDNQSGNIVAMTIKNLSTGQTHMSDTFNKPNTKCMNIANYVNIGDRFYVTTAIKTIDGYKGGSKTYRCISKITDVGLTLTASNDGKQFNYQVTGNMPPAQWLCNAQFQHRYADPTTKYSQILYGNQL
tara:strand:+ start:62 stop:532 length:471 start_codon:yes stop_codon:yes gene_type:complete